MTELSFTKSFLSLLDSRAQKRPADYVLPPTDLDITAPYTLPRMPTPMHKPTTTASGASTGTTTADSAAGGSKQNTVTIHLKSSRPGPPQLSLKLQGVVTATTSILDLKQRVADHLGLGAKSGSGSASGGAGWEKVKVLFARKPVADTKTVKEVLGGDEGIAELYDKRQKATEGGDVAGELEVEFGVMVMGGVGGGGGATGGVAAEGDKAGAEDDVLVGDQFWADLKGFLMQRLKDEEKAGDMLEVFRTSWKGR